MHSKIEATEYHFGDHSSVHLPFYCLFHSRGSLAHTHVDFYEFCFVISGSYYNTYNDETITCQTGHIVFYKKGESHSFINESNNCNHYAFTIQESYFEEFVKKHFDNSSEILDADFISVKLSGPQFAYLSHLASSIARSYSPDRHIIGNLLLEVLIYNCFHPASNIVTDSATSYTHDLMRRFDNYQLLNVDIADIYKEYPISQCTLINAFKALTGSTIVAYRAKKRMEYAAHLLAEENYPINSIAEILNITSPTYFSNQFKQIYGVSPKKYQLLHRTRKEETI